MAPIFLALGAVGLRRPLGQGLLARCAPLFGWGTSPSTWPAGPRPGVMHSSSFCSLFPFLILFPCVFFYIPVISPLTKLKLLHFCALTEISASDAEESQLPSPAVGQRKPSNQCTWFFSLSYPTGCYDQREVPRKDSI